MTSRVIICAPADALLDVSVFAYHCGECGEMVVLSPAGQRMLKREPSAKLLCAACALPPHIARQG